MMSTVRTVAFVPPTLVAHSVSRGARSSMTHASPVTFAARQPRMAVAPLPDDTALDMLSFAMSGPGLFVGTIFALSGIAIVLLFGEVGPRQANSSTFFFLRLEVPSPTRVELPDGSVRNLRAGETLLRLSTREACTAVARRLPQDGLKYSVYRAGGGSMTLLQTFPKEINAKGGAWPSNVVQRRDEGFLDARWEEYQRLGENSDMDDEWKKLMGRLTPIQFEDGGCKLCGGTGYKRCHKCGGASTNARVGSSFECDCEGGRRRCEWCAN